MYNAWQLTSFVTFNATALSWSISPVRNCEVKDDVHPNEGKQEKVSVCEVKNLQAVMSNYYSVLAA